MEQGAHNRLRFQLQGLWCPPLVSEFTCKSVHTHKSNTVTSHRPCPTSIGSTSAILGIGVTALLDNQWFHSYNCKYNHCWSRKTIASFHLLQIFYVSGVYHRLKFSCLLHIFSGSIKCLRITFIKWPCKVFSVFCCLPPCDNCCSRLSINSPRFFSMTILAGICSLDLFSFLLLFPVFSFLLLKHILYWCLSNGCWGSYFLDSAFI